MVLFFTLIFGKFVGFTPSVNSSLSSTLGNSLANFSENFALKSPRMRTKKRSKSSRVKIRVLRFWGLLWNAPKSMWKIYFSRDSLCNFFRNAPFHFRFIFPFKIDHVLFFWNAPSHLWFLFCFKIDHVALFILLIVSKEQIVL